MFRSAALTLALALSFAPVAPAAWAQAPPDSATTAPAALDSAAKAPVARDTLPRYVHSSPPGHAIRWYEPLAVLGGIALASSLDEPVANHFRDHRSQTAQDVADAWAKVGTVGVGVVTAGVLAGGLISHNDKVTHAGLRLAFSAALAGGVVEGMKFGLGRERPSLNTSALDFDPGHLDTSFPSGHTALAFAMAASLSDDIHRTWATVGLYGLATGVAASRVYQQQHWVSDVLGGAALGITSAKLVSGRWRILGLQPPRFLISSRGPVIGWSMAFRE
jgi:membrane-associated phospholipid phosphatase